MMLFLIGIFCLLIALEILVFSIDYKIDLMLNYFNLNKKPKKKKRKK